MVNYGSSTLRVSLKNALALGVTGAFFGDEQFYM